MPDLEMHMRPFTLDDLPACLDVFDSNCPAFFAPSERSDYERFLNDLPTHYRVCIRNGSIIGAYGLKVAAGKQRGRIQWILIDASAHGTGLGTRILRRVIAAARSHELTVIDIAASQKSAPFFSRFGATERDRVADGWGPGLDRVHMELAL